MKVNMEPPFKIPLEAKRRKIRFQEAPEKDVYAEVEESEDGYAHLKLKTELGEYELWFTPDEQEVAFRIENKSGSFGAVEKVRKI